MKVQSIVLSLECDAQSMYFVVEDKYSFQYTFMASWKWIQWSDWTVWSYGNLLKGKQGMFVAHKKVVVWSKDLAQVSFQEYIGWYPC